MERFTWYQKCPGEEIPLREALVLYAPCDVEP